MHKERLIESWAVDFVKLISLLHHVLEKVSGFEVYQICKEQLID